MKVNVPGDKSITQRVLILASLASGESRLSGLLHGGDVESTAEALRSLGVGLPSIPTDGSEIRITGVGLNGLRSPSKNLDLGNSGTGARLLLGVLAGSQVEATLVGDASLQSRPMRRVCEPLHLMGARLEHLGEEGRIPIRVDSAPPLRSIDWLSPVPSAQVKSAILFAGLVGGARAVVTETLQSRDHTERLFAEIGVPLSIQEIPSGHQVELSLPPDIIDPLDFSVPGDVSSAAFIIAFVALRGGGPSVTIDNVSLNPTRTGFLDVFSRMGTDLTIEKSAFENTCEPRGSITASPSELQGTEVDIREVPTIIDELPIIAAMGACSEGRTIIRGASELRLKESDRIHSLVQNLQALGVKVLEHDDGLEIEGASRPLKGQVRTFGDHRIAMSFGVLSRLEEANIEIDDPTLSDISFPGFWKILDKLTQAA
ncbi:MAG: 3-phosphoshikimate 1-carboxyvinyltransferase [Gemmatimonadota bacterium]|nr:3-phosphoshikimate 1-carboxyvinyltransferase [Gemmatimonadota bacterium]